MREKAFTLIELLVAIGVLTFITGIGITLFTSLTQQYDKASSITNLQAEGNRIMEQMARTVRNSSEITSPDGCSNSIDLKIPEETSNLEYGSNGSCSAVEFVYDGAGHINKNVSGSDCTGSGSILNNDTTARVSLAQFCTTDNTNRPDEVKIEFTLTASGSDQSQAAKVSFSKTVLTRNY